MNVKRVREQREDQKRWAYGKEPRENGQTLREPLEERRSRLTDRVN
jgi:hypothetical protein